MSEVPAVVNTRWRAVWIEAESFTVLAVCVHPVPLPEPNETQHEVRLCQPIIQLDHLRSESPKLSRRLRMSQIPGIGKLDPEQPPVRQRELRIEPDGFAEFVLGRHGAFSLGYISSGPTQLVVIPRL